MTIYKLRFRVEGRQRVVYLGTDPARVQRIKCELEELQHRVRTARELRKLSRQAKDAMRASRRQLAPLLEQAGFHFHGIEIRETRRPRTSGASEATDPI